MKSLLLFILFVLIPWTHLMCQGNKTETVLVILNDTSLEKLGSFPVPRSVYSRALSTLRDQYSVKTICFDFCIDLPSKVDSEGDQQLFNTVASMDHLIMNMMIGKQSNDFKLNKYQRNKSWRSVNNMTPFFYKSALFPMDELLSEGVTLGVSGTYSNKDLNLKDNHEASVYPTSFKVKGLVYPSIALAGAFDFLGIDSKDEMSDLVNVEPYYYDVDLSLDIPIFELTDILNGKIDVAQLEDKMVVFGAGATGFGQDLYTAKGPMNTSLYMAMAAQTFLNYFKDK